jgi:hypothetical protein
MPLILICSESALLDDLSETPLGRRDLELRAAVSLEEAQSLVIHQHPSLIVIDRDLKWARPLITLIREEARMRDASIVVAARGASSVIEKDLLADGADVILRLPSTTAWDDHIDRLLSLSTRRDIRVPLTLRVDAQVGDDLVDATIINLGLRGMLIQSPVPLEVGCEIEFAIRIPGDKQLLTGSGRVARQASSTQYGVEFLLLEKEDQERLYRLLCGAQGE